jgi:GDP-L-fucose synthase
MEHDARIYVAGHTGMVGSAIVRKLIAEGYTNLILHSRDELDLLDQNAVYNFFEREKPEYVFDCAARVGGIKANMEFSADFLYENLQIQNNILWGAHMHGATKVLFLSASCCYPRDCSQPMKEEYLLEGRVEPTNEGYAIAKIAGMKLCEKIFEQHGKDFISCTPTNAYGLFDKFDANASHVIPAMILKFHNAKINQDLSVTMWGTGVARRDFLFVDDMADACLFLMNNFKVPKEGPKFVNVGTGSDVTIKELAEIVARVVGFDGKIEWDASKPDGMLRKSVDVTRIHDLGWSHKTNLETGIVQTYEWFLKDKIA